jgi:hypothetical protein
MAMVPDPAAALFLGVERFFGLIPWHTMGSKDFWATPWTMAMGLILA